MEFIVITYIPPRQGLINGIEEKVTIDETEGESAEHIMHRLHVPLGGYCLVIDKKNITKITSKTVKEITQMT